MNSLPIPSLFLIAGLAVFTTALYSLALILYNLYLHPLSRFPGPLLYRSTRLAFLVDLLRGKLALKVLPLHEQYGPVVRIAPDELSFSSPSAWRDIYGHRIGSNSGVEELPKSAMWYRSKGTPPSILGESRENHSLLRRQLSYGFSERALRSQEGIIGGYVDLLIARLKEHCIDPHAANPATGDRGARRPVDLTKWYNRTTFDIIGDLAFGEPFGSLEKASTDPFVSSLSNTLMQHRWVHFIKFMGLETVLMPVFRYLASSKKEYGDRTRKMLERRVATKREDFIQGLLDKTDEWDMKFGHVHMNASILLIAGSETTATLLTGVTYLLLRNPQWLRRVTEEVRGAYREDKDITLLTVADGRLETMMACLQEAMRVYPPTPFGMPRTVPEESKVVRIAGEDVPGGTTVAVWQYALYHNEAYFADPFGFHPERFLEPQNPRFKNDRLDGLQPFSVGPRNCIGKNLAYAEMRLVLAKILFNFDMGFVNDEKSANWLDQTVYVLWRKPPLEVYLTPRTL